MNEVWKDIDGYEGLYQISSLGRVKSTQYHHGTYERILKPKKNKTGYLSVQLCKNGKIKYYYMHRLVAMAFLDNPYNYKEINHKNEVKTDNRVENLEWCDRKYNMNYGTIIEKTSKKVFQYTLDGEFIAEYPSTMEVHRQLGFAHTHISDCCNGRLKTAYGYIWSYIKEPQSN